MGKSDPDVLCLKICLAIIGAFILVILATGGLCGADLIAIFERETDRPFAINARQQLAAQISVESAWRPNACSQYACGLAQFTAPTWDDISPYTKPSCEGVDYRDPACSIRSQIVYMRRLLYRYRGSASRTDQWAMAWAAYNGGPGWIDKERRRCRSVAGCDPTQYFQHVQDECIRAEWACRENTAYPGKILRAMDRAPASYYGE